MEAVWLLWPLMMKNIVLTVVFRAWHKSSIRGMSGTVKTTSLIPIADLLFPPITSRPQWLQTGSCSLTWEKHLLLTDAMGGGWHHISINTTSHCQAKCNLLQLFTSLLGHQSPVEEVRTHINNFIHIVTIREISLPLSCPHGQPHTVHTSSHGESISFTAPGSTQSLRITGLTDRD